MSFLVLSTRDYGDFNAKNVTKNALFSYWRQFFQFFFHKMFFQSIYQLSEAQNIKNNVF